MGADTPSESLHFFGGSRTAIFLSIAGRIVPDEGLSDPGAKSRATLQTAESFLRAQVESVQAKFALLLKVFEWGAVLRFGRRFTRLPGRKQDAYLRSWEFSRLQLFRFGFSSLRNLVLVAFYTREESWPMIGYPGPVLEAKVVKP